MMSRHERVRWIVALTLAAWLLVVAPASAYIDPGSTTFIFQAIVAFVAAAGMTLRVYWRRITGFFRRDGDVEPAASRDERVTTAPGHRDQA